MYNMKKKPLRRIDKSLFISTILLFIVGLIMIFSASNVTAYIKQGDSPYIYFIKQFIFLIGGFVIFIIFIHMDSRKYKRIFPFLSYITVALLIILLVHGKATNGATSWFSIFGFGLQPSEFLKVFSILWLASYYETKKSD